MGKPVRTLFVTHAAEFGGSELSLFEILERLDRNRVNPALASFSDGPLADAVKNLGIDVRIVSGAERIVRTRRADFVSYKKFYPVALGAASVVPGAIELAKYAKSQKVDVIYTNSSKAHILGGIAGRISRARVVWHFRDIFSNEIIRGFFSRSSALLADTVVCNSQATAGQFDTHRDSRVIYNGLPVEKVINSRTAEEIRTELGISIDAKVIGNVSRLVEIKGIEDLIEAAALIASDVSNASFIVAGSPVYGDMKYVNKLKKVVSSKGLSDRFHFIGHREDIYDVINAFDIYVHTASSPESFGRAIVEAMLLNKVVVASNAGGPSEIVKEGETGFLFAPGDANSLADLLTSLLRESEKPRRMGKEGRRRALELFAADRAVEEITRMLEEKKVQH